MSSLHSTVKNVGSFMEVQIKTKNTVCQNKDNIVCDIYIYTVAFIILGRKIQIQRTMLTYVILSYQKEPYLLFRIMANY